VICPLGALLHKNVRTFVGGPLHIFEQKKMKTDMVMVHIDSKECVDTLNFRFDSSPPVYINRMQKG
jgi:hypothetical protein